MQVDWITVAAQIVNFLVLVWLLQRFLYGPIVRAMARREERIAARMRDAETARATAEAEAEAHREKQAELERRRDAMLDEAREAAETERRALERAAREEVERRKAAWLAQVEDEKGEFLRDLRESSTRHFYALARRALGDLADAELEEQIVRVFLRKLEGLGAAEREKVAESARRAGGGVTVRSRFEIAGGDKARITRAIHETLLEGAEVDYQADPDATAGLELRAGGQSVSWSLDSYFDGLERLLADEIGAGRPGEA